MSEAYEYPSRVTLGEDGFYRWSYEVDMSAKGAVYESVMKVLGIIAICVAASAFLMPSEARWIVALPAGGMMIVPALFWLVFYRGKAARQRMRYAMNEEKIHIPGLYKSEDTAFPSILGVSAQPAQNMIELRTAAMTLIQVFAPEEDFEFVRDYIINHVSPLANVKTGA
ncbi:MAG: hypothetical protein IKO07_10045 [Clostridia bacterium]|nr:hypothetical protein [Clostridia bacterium]